jgi:hypothetical protein
MKEDLVKVDQEWLRPQMNRESFHLLVDCYSAHRTMDGRAWAVQLRIILYDLPARGTDQFQPLDILIFRALKTNGPAAISAADSRSTA